jgi:hypothetical protein
VKLISILGLGGLLALASAAAPAQDFTAGKTPAQLFGSDCAECHRTANGLAKNRDVKSLAGFLREHYTTKPDTAGALAAYVSGFGGNGAADARNRGGATPAAAATAGPGERSPAERRNKRDNETTATGDDARTGAKPLDETAGRRRRNVNLSGDGEKRRARSDGDAPRPPGAITAAPPRASSPAGDSASREATDPISRLRAYMSSGLGLDGTIAEVAKAGPPKSRKHRDRKDTATEAPTAAKAGAEAAPAATTAAPGTAAAPAEGGAPPPVPATASAPTVAPAPPVAPVPAAPAAPTVAPGSAAVVTPPRLGQ